MNARVVTFTAALYAAAASAVMAGQVTTPVLVDPDLTIGAGATITTAIGEVVARAEDAVVPHRLFGERGILRRSGNVTFRLVKWTLLDAPQERLLQVVTHEVFGHGARLRERFDGPVGYRIGVPAPYGRGGGSTSFVFDREPTRHERLAVNVAGMEADAVGAALVAHRALSRGRMRPRDAYRYLLFEFDTLSYVWGTDDAGEEPGHDVDDFLEAYNELPAEAAGSALTAGTLRRQALVGLANPMVGYAVYGIGRYLWNGSTDVSVPVLSIAGVRYLPMFRYRLAPYGTEWSLVNELGGRVRPTQVEVRIGRSPETVPWGIGVRREELATWRGWSMDGAIEAWRQPRLATTANEAPTSTARLGARVRARAERPLIPVWFSSNAATLVVDVGVKTNGFAPGEPLGGGIVARAGVGLPF